MFSKNDSISLEEVLKRAFNNIGVYYYDVSVDFDMCKIYIDDAPDSIKILGREEMSQSYFNKVKTIIRSHLPNDYRLLPQDEIQLESTERNKRLVIHFELVESKRINGAKVVTTGYEIPLMKDVYWDVSKQPHGIVTGVTGSGKSMLINYLFKQFQYMDADIYAIDPKFADLYILGKNKLKVGQYASEKVDILELLQQLNQILTVRQKLLASKNKIGLDAYKDGMRPIVLFFDELAAFKDSLESKQEKDAYNSYLKNLVLKGRSAGINIVLSLQKPLAEDIPTSVRDQLGFRLVLGRNTSEDTKKLIFGINDKNVLVTDETEVKDDWQTATLSQYDGWYSLPNMSEKFRAFEAPNLKELKL